MALASLGKRKHTIIINEKLDGEIKTYIRERAIEIISKGGSIPSESQLFEELLTKGLQVTRGRSLHGDAAKTTRNVRRVYIGSAVPGVDENKSPSPDIAIQAR
jgi:hypothetical protein